MSILPADRICQFCLLYIHANFAMPAVRTRPSFASGGGVWITPAEPLCLAFLMPQEHCLLAALLLTRFALRLLRHQSKGHLLVRPVSLYIGMNLPRSTGCRNHEDLAWTGNLQSPCSIWTFSSFCVSSTYIVLQFHFMITWEHDMQNLELLRSSVIFWEEQDRGGHERHAASCCLLASAYVRLLSSFIRANHLPVAKFPPSAWLLSVCHIIRWWIAASLSSHKEHLKV